MSNESVLIADAETLTTGGVPAYSIQINNSNHTRGYLVIKTDNEVGTASIATVVQAASSAGYFTIATLSAITTETTTVALLGSDVAAGEGVDEVFDFPLTDRMLFVFTIGGGGAEMDITAYLHLVDN